MWFDQTGEPIVVGGQAWLVEGNSIQSNSIIFHAFQRADLPTWATNRWSSKRWNPQDPGSPTSPSGQEVGVTRATSLYKEMWRKNSSKMGRHYMFSRELKRLVVSPFFFGTEGSRMQVLEVNVWRPAFIWSSSAWVLRWMRRGDGWWLVALLVQLGKNSWHWKPWRNCILDRVAYIIFHILWVATMREFTTPCCWHLQHAISCFSFPEIFGNWDEQLSGSSTSVVNPKTSGAGEERAVQLVSSVQGKKRLWFISEMIWESSVKSLLGVMDLIMSYCAPLKPKASFSSSS